LLNNVLATGIALIIKKPSFVACNKPQINKLAISLGARALV
jgi:hypothetical protein